MKTTISKFALLLFSLLLVACSKEESETDQIDKNGAPISRYQIVTVDVGTSNLTNDFYTGTFAGNPVQLAKTTEHELAFYVPETAPLGATELIIPSLNNTKIEYDVSDLVLTQSVEETLNPLNTNFDTYGNQLTTSSEDLPFVQNHNSMLTYFNGLSEADKAEVAKFYKANKSIIDAVFNTDYSTIQGRGTQSGINMQENRVLVLQFKAALVVGIVGATVAVLEPSNIIRPIAIGIAIAGISSAVDYHFQLIDRNLNVVQMRIDAILGTNNRSVNSQLTLTDNVAATLPFYVNARPIQEADSNSQQEYMKLYFTTKNRLNHLINDVNDAILWVNENIPFVTFNTLPLAVVSTSATPVSTDVDSQIMQKLNFTLNHPNLSLENATLQSNGQLNIKVKFTGNPATTPINSTLNYTYNDDFSSFSGSFPIEVNSSVSNLVNFSFYNQYDISTCLGPTSFSCNWKLLVTFSGGSPVGGTIFHRTLYDNQNDGVFEEGTVYYTASVTNANTSLNNGIYTVNPQDNGYCWGNPNTQLKVEYYYVSPAGAESPHYFSSVPKN